MFDACFSHLHMNPAVAIHNLSVSFPGKRIGEQIRVLENVSAEVAVANSSAW